MKRNIAALAGVAFALSALCGANTASADAHAHIVGGTKATGDTGYVASIRYTAIKHNVVDHHTCGGALVFPGWVATAAHCVTDEPGGSDPIPTADKKFSVQVGSKDRTQGGEIRNVVQVVVDPRWKWGSDPMLDNAMLRLENPVDIQPIRVAPREARPGAAIRLYGWGVWNPDGSGPLPTQLQQLDTRVIPAWKCADAGITRNEICTNNPHGTDGPGPGDSGGPAVVVDEDGVPMLVGICSRASKPLPGEAPTVYTSSAAYRAWMFDVARGRIPAPATTHGPAQHDSAQAG
ncbi:serine protease (plasmid) [Amycolatopsis sp. AA4]|uniref:S1 family peptidase n=1 Tax=Actinomycetes TaxID=1760 RepID=UPI0001B55C0D|nr:MULTISPECIES: trypsin-like serine protease [Actinomycetes]ATY17035.1 serine protease [Amycolatopsis sp. AA4]EFL12473.1 hypothetical protein SSMG_08144 [Streptomyces sp. AA4]